MRSTSAPTLAEPSVAVANIEAMLGAAHRAGWLVHDLKEHGRADLFATSIEFATAVLADAKQRGARWSAVIVHATDVTCYVSVIR